MTNTNMTMLQKHLLNLSLYLSCLSLIDPEIAALKHDTNQMKQTLKAMQVQINKKADKPI